MQYNDEGINNYYLIPWIALIVVKLVLVALKSLVRVFGVSTQDSKP